MPCLIDQSFDHVGNNTHNLRTSSSQTGTEAAVQFTPSRSGEVICRVDLQVYKVGVPTGNIFVKIYSDTSNSPNTVLTSGQSNSIDVSTLSTVNNGAYTSFTWTAKPSTPNSVKYWISVAGDWTLSDTNYAIAGIFNPNGPPIDSLYLKGTWTVDGFAGNSMPFKQYSQPASNNLISLL